MSWRRGWAGGRRSSTSPCAPSAGCGSCRSRCCSSPRSGRVGQPARPSSVIVGAVHLSSALATATSAIVVSFSGYMFYLTRRLFGAIWLAMRHLRSPRRNRSQPGDEDQRTRRPCRRSRRRGRSGSRRSRRCCWSGRGSAGRRCSPAAPGMKLTTPSKARTKTRPIAIPPPSERASRPKPKPTTAAAIQAGTEPKSVGRRGRRRRSSTPARLAARWERPPAAAATSEPPTTAPASDQRQLVGEHAVAVGLGGQGALHRPGAELQRGEPDAEDHRGERGGQCRPPCSGSRCTCRARSAATTSSTTPYDHRDGGDQRRRPARRRQVADLGELGVHAAPPASSLPCQLEERLLERRAAHRQPAQVDALLGQRAGDDRRVLRRSRGDDLAVADVRARRARAPPTIRQRRLELVRRDADRQAARRRPGAITSSQRAPGDQPAVLEHDDVVAGRLDLGQPVGAEQRRRAALGQRADEVADLDGALGVEPVGRLVEHHDRRVADQRQRDPDPLAHPQRERADRVVGAVGRARPGAGSRRTSASLRREAHRPRPGSRGSASALSVLVQRRRLDDHPDLAGRLAEARLTRPRGRGSARARRSALQARAARASPSTCPPRWARAARPRCPPER